jgi:diguanylate cyclase (GGDEF)-like protein
MAIPSFRLDSSKTIVVVGTLLGVYLAILLTIGHFGQRSLQQALTELEQLHLQQQAESFDTFLNQRLKNISALAHSPPIKAYLANRDLGMSMRYGLRASLNQVQRHFRTFINDEAAFDGARVTRIAFTEPDGRVLLEVSADELGSAPNAAVAPPNRTATAIANNRDNATTLTFGSPVLFKGTERGTISAEYDADVSLRRLWLNDSPAAHERRSALLSNDGQVVTSRQGSAWNHWYLKASHSNATLIEYPIGDSGMRVITIPQTDLGQRFISSSGFLAAVALLSIPLLLGIGRLLRLNNHNLVLKTRYQSTPQQRMLLRQQNDRLRIEIEKRLASEQQLAHQANYDQLTGLPNRNLATDRLAQSLKRARRENSSVLVLFLDLDRFKQVNDSLGHAAGDELLRQAAQRLRTCVRESDTVSRQGGDEFLVICPEVPIGGEWQECARQLLKALAAPFHIDDHEFYIGASIGVAAYPEAGDIPNKLLKNADIAMYAAKQRGRNRFCLYEPAMDVAALENMRLENCLRHALERNELSLEYQPIVELQSGRAIAVEALLRWDNPEFGRVSPDRFIPIAEETGLIHAIGEWVLDRACQQIAEIQPDHHFRLAINLSPRQFSRPGLLLDIVLRALRSSGLMPAQLELEVTESILIDDHPEVAGLLEQLDRIGVRLSLDDFGTGYSALNYLQRFPFDVLKIDRSFTAQIPGNPANANLIKAIIAMSHALDLEVIAEGIEKREQTGFLLVHHCEFGQGYLYNKPLTIDQLVEYFDQETALLA